MPRGLTCLNWFLVPYLTCIVSEYITTNNQHEDLVMGILYQRRETKIFFVPKFTIPKLGCRINTKNFGETNFASANSFFIISFWLRK
ncbi:hypothetical protein BpHYR1_013904 [Brachionus plicatilis]|uniref:Secreted protein n=1 Tax=Brachionus plicatilis TaxID=10195 RepID=A0A3M7PLE5_BRAPC|nr:hypothetical protein BpHYR1_013904 [Brachionus plicatilis]